MGNLVYLAVGSELLEGVRQETNGYLLSRVAGDRGWNVIAEFVVRDRVDEIVAALNFAATMDVDMILVSGGLGPTEDDITREAVAHWSDRKLIFVEECWKKIEERFARRGMVPPEINRKQAMIPEGFSVVPNPVGTACGFRGNVKDRDVVVLPGVPMEFEEMIESVIPSHESHFPVKFDIRLYGIAESSLNELIEPLMRRYVETSFSFLPEFPEIYLRVRGRDDPDSLRRDLERVIGKYVYSWDGKILPVVFGEELKKRSLFFAVAESCTGGLVAKTITDIPGSSHYFDRGFVTYSNQAKMDLLGVNRETLEKYGAVSEQTAREMVEGVLSHSNAQIAASITGIAGPSGGSPEKPVGTVYTAIADVEGRIEVVRNFFPGNREQVRRQTMVKVLFGVLKWVERFFPE